MKRIIAILLVVSMLFGFSGCATKADKLAAAELSEKISSIGTVKLTSEEKINDIKAQYDALSDKQKKRVENVDVLDNAVAELNKLIEEKNAKDVANVEKLIEQIGNVTAD